MNKTVLWFLFVFYTLLFEFMVWGGFFYIVFILNKSSLWIILAIGLSSAQFKPYHFGLISRDEYGIDD